MIFEKLLEETQKRKIQIGDDDIQFLKEYCKTIEIVSEEIMCEFDDIKLIDDKIHFYFKGWYLDIDFDSQTGKLLSYILDTVNSVSISSNNDGATEIILTYKI